MVKIIKYIVLLVSLIVFVFSCKPTNVKEREKEEARTRRTFETNTIGWDTLSVDTLGLFAMTGLETQMHLKINLKVPNQYEKEEILKKINKELLSQALGTTYADTTQQVAIIFDKFIGDYLSNYSDKMKRYGESQYKKKHFEKLEHSYELDTEVLYNEANLISYQIRIFEKTGNDSVGKIMVDNLLLDLTDGRRLHEDDIFKEEYGFRSQLNLKLQNQIIVDNKQDSIQGLQALGYWGIADIEANNNFYVDNTSVTYTFNPGEYADAKNGVLKISMDYYTLRDVLKKDSPITILANEWNKNYSGSTSN